MPFVKYEIEFEEGVSIKNLSENNIYYALPENSLIDLAALDLYTSNVQVNSPIDRNKHTGLHNFICIFRPAFNPSEQKIKRKLPHNLKEILTTSSEGAKFLPVSFYWGMHPEKQKSIFKIIFSQSWGATGPIKKMFRLLFHGRSLLIKFNKPLLLEELNVREKAADLNAHLINRYIRALFRKNKKAAIGPDVSHRRTLVKSLSKDKEVRKEISTQARNESTKNRLRRKAFKYANEICSDISYPIVRLLQRGLTWFWNNRYEGINVKNIENIKSIANSNALIYVPCHRSHIDYLALSYVLLERGLMLPHIAAGNNLNLPILGRILRGGGAFFMRRSFVKNKLYSVVFFQYLKRLMMRGSSIEFFPEGGRSRTGLSLPPRPGLISMILRSFAGLKIDNVKIVPTYIGYEKIIEGKSYLSELLGRKKKKESLFDIFRSIKDFNNFLGNAFINFGEPIDLNEFLVNELNGEDFSIHSSLERPKWLKTATSNLGLEIIKGINSSTTITSTSVFALALLTSKTQSLEYEEMVVRIELFMNLIREEKIFKNVWIPETTGKQIIRRSEELKLVKHQMIGSAKVFRPNEETLALLSYYKNNIVHLYVFFSLICQHLRYNKISKEDLLDSINLIYPWLKKEFNLIWSKNKLEKILDNSLKQLIQLKLIKSLSSGSLSQPNTNTQTYSHFLSICSITDSILKENFIVLKTLSNKKFISLEELQKVSLDYSKKVKETSDLPYTKLSDPQKLRHIIESLVQEDYVKEDTHNVISVSSETNKLKTNLKKILDKDFIQEVDQLG